VDTRRIYRFEEAEWHVPVAPGTDPEAAAAAGRQGARAASAQGDAGFTRTQLPPDGLPGPSHDHAEVLWCRGAASSTGQSMERFDLTAAGAERTASAPGFRDRRSS
jgi:hypothetical protein